MMNGMPYHTLPIICVAILLFAGCDGAGSRPFLIGQEFEIDEQGVPPSLYISELMVGSSGHVAVAHDGGTGDNGRFLSQYVPGEGWTQVEMPAGIDVGVLLGVDGKGRAYVFGMSYASTSRLVIAEAGDIVVDDPWPCTGDMHCDLWEGAVLAGGGLVVTYTLETDTPPRELGIIRIGPDGQVGVPVPVEIYGAAEETPRLTATTMGAGDDGTVLLASAGVGAIPGSVYAVTPTDEVFVTRGPDVNLPALHVSSTGHAFAFREPVRAYDPAKGWFERPELAAVLAAGPGGSCVAAPTGGDKLAFFKAGSEVPAYELETARYPWPGSTWVAMLEPTDGMLAFDADGVPISIFWASNIPENTEIVARYEGGAPRLQVLEPNTDLQAGAYVQAIRDGHLAFAWGTSIPGTPLGEDGNIVWVGRAL